MKRPIWSRKSKVALLVLLSSGFSILVTGSVYPESDMREAIKHYTEDNGKPPDEKMLITCTDSFQAQDLQGHIISEQSFPGKQVRYGGVSRNGKRFVLVVTKRSTSDP